MTNYLETITSVREGDFTFCEGFSFSLKAIGHTVFKICSLLIPLYYIHDIVLANILITLRGYCTPVTLSYGSDQQCSKELKKSKFNFSRDHGCEVTVTMCENQYFPCFDP